ncbi:MAG: HAD family hydrolase [Planctomycetota bacterium]|jgi:HAD superfamily hydrolase (TIGR01549 family)
MSDLKAVFFDVNGTLWDNQSCACHVMEIVLPQFTPPLPEEETAEILRRFNAVFLDLPRREHMREKRPFSRVRRFEGLLESYSIKKRGLARELSYKYDSVRRFVMRQFLRRDAHHVLDQLGQRGLQRGVIMNGAPAVQRHVVQSLGLQPHMEHIILGEIEGYSKPDARLFRRALELAGVEPGEMLYVGDSPVTDILGAARAGIPTVWLNTGRRRLPRSFPAPDFTVTRLSEVLTIADAS